MYQALYRKYRPRTFDEVVGQESITKTLKTQVATGRLSHAYLFTGTRGTGKTSCAKILARAVNCEHPVDGNPCNSCAACRSIESGACMDVLEIDAASNNGVDHVRALRDDAVYTPAEVKKRVYIIDEVHMLSTAAFNALLKIIEEPPEHLIFILATTELHKVPATILSRCQRFSFRRLRPEDIAARLSYIAWQEGVDLDPEAARVLSRLADGALRDGVSLLDQCASAATGAVTADEVYECLGLSGEQQTGEMLRLIGERRTDGVLRLFSRLYDEGKDMGALLDELCAAARDLLILKCAPKGGLSMLSGIASEETSLAGLFSTGELSRMVEILQQTMSGLSRSGNLRIDVELCLIKLCNPSLMVDGESLNARLTRLEEQLSSGHLVAPAAPAAVREERKEEPAPAAPERAEEAPPEETGKNGEGAAPPGFWPDLVSALRTEFQPPVRGFFAVDGPIHPQLRGDTLLLLSDSEFVRSMIARPEVLQAVGARASVLLRRTVQAKAELRKGPSSEDGRDPLANLLEKGKSLGGRMTVK